MLRSAVFTALLELTDVERRMLVVCKADERRTVMTSAATRGVKANDVISVATFWRREGERLGEHPRLPLRKRQGAGRGVRGPSQPDVARHGGL